MASVLPAYWLECEGDRVFVGPASVLVGRDPECDIVLSDPRASRHHVLFRLSESGVEMVPFGRLPVAQNGEARTAPTPLRAGDRVECVGLTFVLVEAPAQVPEADVLWGIERTPGALFRVTQGGFRVGGAPDDDLVVMGWERTVFVLHLVGNALDIEPLREGISAAGVRLEAGDCVRLRPGARVEHGGRSLRVVALPRDPTKATDTNAPEPRPTGVEMQFLPRGGRLTVSHGSHAACVYLSDRRCDLVASLLQPPRPFEPGELVPDEVLVGRIWPGQSAGRLELNTLVHRTRKDMAKAGLAGGTLLERLAGGVRFGLAPGAVVKVRGQ